MAEEVAGTPKPERSITPLPKVLVQQASEDKSDGITNNGSDAAGVNGNLHKAGNGRDTPQPSLESTETNGNNDDSKSENRNCEPMKSRGESDMNDRTVEATAAAEVVGRSDTHIEKETKPDENINGHAEEGQSMSEMTKSYFHRPRPRTPEEFNGNQNQSLEEGSENNKPQSATERPRSETPEEVDVNITLLNGKNSGERKEEDEPSADEKHEDGRTESKTPESRAIVHEATEEVIATEEPRVEETTKLSESPNLSIKSKERAEKEPSPSPENHSTPSGSIAEDIPSGKLLELVVNEAKTDSGRKSPGSCGDDNDRVPQPHEIGHQERPVGHQDHVAAATATTGADQENSEKPVGSENADKPETPTSKPPDTIRFPDEAGSVTSEERAEVENAYDASVSGNEDDSPEKRAEDVKEKEIVADASSYIATSVPEKDKSDGSRSPSLSFEKLIEGRSPSEPVEKNILPNQNTIEISGVPSPQSSPKIVKVVRDTEPFPSSDSTSVEDLATTQQVLSNKENIDDNHLDRMDFVATPDVSIRLGDLQEQEGNEAPELEPVEPKSGVSIEEYREEESKSSEDPEDDNTVVEHDSIYEQSASFAHIAQLEDERKKKDIELEHMKDEVKRLEEEIDRLKGENEEEHKKANDMSLQIKRMTDENKENVKTIQGNEERIRTLEGQIETYKANQSNGSSQARKSTTPTPETKPKKSSVCVIL